MKRAVWKGMEIEASPDAPERAVCPHCGADVLLRRRKTMLDGETWYWRHAQGAPRACPGRAPMPGMRRREVDND